MSRFDSGRGYKERMKMKHPISISIPITHENVVKQITNLRYDSLHQFLLELSRQFKYDSNDDFGHGRFQLAEHLKNASSLIREAAYELEIVWKICEPYMKEEIDQ
jgi:hypothetical protein